MTHTSTEKPEALRLARKFEEVGFMGDHRFAKDHWCRQAAAELRRQHARIEELEAAQAQVVPQGYRLQPLSEYDAMCAFIAAAAHQPPEGLMATKPAAAPLQMPKPVGWFHRHPNECKNGELCNYQLASGDRKDGWEESPVYTEQQVRTLLAGVPTPAVQEGWCDGCSPDNCCGCGPAAPAHVQPEPNKGSSHETC